MGKKSQRSKNTHFPQPKQAESGNPTVVVTLITVIGTVTVALITVLFQFPPFIALFQKVPTVTPTVISVAPIASPTFFTETPFSLINLPLITDTPELSSITATVTNTPPPTSTATENSSLPIGMSVLLSADKTTGKTPVTVKFDARNSFLRASDGTIYPCKGGPCHYTWEVYTGGQRIKTTTNSSGTFEYTFGKKGTYFVTVLVCRGLNNSDCKGSGAQVVAR